MKKAGFLLGIFFVINTLQLNAATVTSTGKGGNWSNPATWVGNIVPGEGDDVTIAYGTTVVIDADTSVKSLTVMGELLFEAVAPRTLAVADILTINEKGSFSSGASGNIKTHRLKSRGSIINNGILDFSAGNNQTGAEIEFTGAENAIFNCSDALQTNLKAPNGLVLNKGTSPASVLSFIPGTRFEVMSDSGSNAPGFLRILNGTFNLIGSKVFINPVFDAEGDIEIPATGGFWLGNQNITVLGGKGNVLNYGDMKISGGSFQVGNDGEKAIENLEKGKIEISGGSLIAGKVNIVSGSLYVLGGSVSLANVADQGDGEPSLGVSANARFEMYGNPLIVLKYPHKGSKIVNDIQVAARARQKAIKSGIIQLGTEATPLGSVFYVDGNEVISRLKVFSECDIRVLNTSGVDIGNASADKLPVIAFDKTAPTLVAPSQVTLNCGENMPMPYASLPEFLKAGGQASDNCSLVEASFKLTKEVKSSEECPYTITRTYQVSDASGNKTEVEQKLVVSGGTAEQPAPVMRLKSAMAGLTITTSANPPAICAGASSSLSVNPTSGVGPYTYSWTPSAVLDNSTIATPIATPTSTTTYAVTVTDTSNGNTTTGTVTVTVNQFPLIVTPPTDVLDCEDASVNFKVTVSGAVTSYVWQRLKGGTGTWTDIPLSESDISFPNSPDQSNIQVSNVGGNNNPRDSQYRVVVSNGGCSATSTAATLTVNEITALTGGTDVAQCYGTTYSYTVSTSYPALTYQWKKSVVSGVWNNVINGGAYSGATSNKLTITGGTPAESAEYRVYMTFDAYPGADCNVTSTGRTRKITFLPQVQAGTISGTQTICYNTTPAQLTATAATGGSVTPSFAYQWQSSTDNSTWNGIGGAMSLTYQPPALTSSTYYRIVATDNGAYACGTATSTSVLITVNPNQTITLISGSASQTVCINSVITNIAYTIGGGATNATVAGLPTGVSGTLSGNTYTISGTPTTSGTFNYTVTTSGTCAVATATGSVTVNLLPTATVSGTTAVCQNASSPNITFTGSNGTAPYTFTYKINGGSNQSVSTSSGNSVTVSVPTAVAGTFAYSLVSVQDASATACSQAQTGTATVTVNPLPTATATPSSATICSGDVFSASLSGNMAGTTFTWIVADSPAGSTTGAASGSGATISQTLTNTTSGLATVTYTITPRANGCDGAPINLLVTVRPKPALTSSLTASVCSSAPFSYTPASNVAGTSFSWTRAAVVGISNSASSGTDPGFVNETLINTTGSSKDVKYRFTLTANGCTTIQDVVVTVYPAPTLSSTLNPSAVCSNSAITYNAVAAIVGTTMNWSRAVVPGISNAAASGSGNISEVLVNTGSSPVVVSYVYTLTVGGCTNTQTVNVTVNPSPTVTVPSNLEYCNGDVVPAISFTSTVSGTTYTWANDEPGIGLTSSGSGNLPSFTAVNTGGSTITATISVRPSANGCIGTNSTFLIVVYPSPKGGTLNGTNSVCSGTNNGTLTLTGRLGTIVRWESSIDGGTTWTNISNTTNSLTYTNLTATTVYRVAVKNGPCAETFSTQATITVSSGSVGGSVSGSATVCSGSNSGTLVLSGYTGSIQKWQSSINGGVSWSDIGNLTTSQTYTNVTTTTQYRVAVQNGACPVVYSTPNATITVDPVSVGGNTSGDATVCSGSNSGSVTLSGHTGNVVKWQYSTNGGGTWVDIANTTTSLTYTNLTATTQYRAVVQSGVCSPANSSTSTITVNPVSVGGSITGGTTVCAGTNNTTLTLSGNTGNVVKWQSSLSPFSSWTDIANNTSSLVVSNLAATTQYRAVVQSGVCASANSATSTIAVDPVSVGGTITGTSSVCSGTNTATLTLSGNTGSVVKWQWTTNNWATTTDIANTTTTLVVNNLAATTRYRAVVQSGTCASTNSSDFVLTVDPLSVGGTVSGTATVCSGSNSGALTLSGQTGNVTKWQSSTNSGSSWTDIANTTTTYNYTNVSANTIYRAVVQSGACSFANSGVATITVTAPTVAGTVSGTATVCSGTNSGTLTLSGNTGSVVRWEYSTNGGTTWTPITNTSTTQSYTNLNATTQYRAVVQNGGCNPLNSGTVTVTVNQMPTLSSTLTPSGICSNDPNGFSYIPTSSVVGTTFEWTRALVAGISNPASFGNNNPDEILFNTTTSPIEVVYNYKLTANGCVNYQDVKVQVTQTPLLTSTLSPPNICSGYTFSYTPTSSISGTTFSWSRAAVAGISNPSASGTGNPNEVLVNTTTNPIGVTYLYSLNSVGCSNPLTYSVIVTVIPAPVVSVSASKTTICPGESIDLFSSATIASTLSPTLLSENFNSAPTGWTTSNSNTGGTPANSVWTFRNSPYNYGGLTFSSNDGSRFYLSNSDAQGNGGVTRTVLNAPSINTVGYSSLSLSFWHYYRDAGSSYGDNAFVEVSTNGTAWTTITTYNSTQGSASNFANAVINLTAYIGRPTLYIRFRYQANWGYYWAIDNVQVTGTPTAVPTINWTSVPAGFSSTVANPTGVFPTQTTRYIATYTDPNTGCNGSESVTVTVTAPPVPTIRYDYCVARPKVRLTSFETYSSYQWKKGGVVLGTGQTVDVDVAGTYTLIVNNGSCVGSSTYTIPGELVVNGDFEYGPNYNNTPGPNKVFDSDYGYRTAPVGAAGYFGIGTDARPYYPAGFRGAHDHTSGSGYYMIVDGTSSNYVVWQQTFTVTPNTDYYFAAWALNIYRTNGAYDPDLQFSVNGQLVGTHVVLNQFTDSDNNPWLFRFYGTWNSGSTTTATVQIRDLQPSTQQNDFGLDDISFATLASVPFTVSASNSGAVCTGGTVTLTASVTGGKPQYRYTWTKPDGSTTSETTVSTLVITNATSASGGTYTVSVKDFYMCDPPVTASTTVTVNTTPSVLPQATTICSGSAFSVIPANGGGNVVPAGTTYTWAAPSGSGFTGGSAQATGVATITQTLTNSGATPVTATYIVTPKTATCTGASFTLTVTVNAAATVNAGTNTSVCSNNPSVKLSGSIGGAATSATWSGGTGTFAPNASTLTATYTPSAAEITAGIVTLTLASNDPDGAGPCTAATSSMTITIKASPILSPSITPVSCYGGSNGAIILSVTNPGPSPTYSWTTTNGVIPSGQANSQNLSGLVAGTYTVTYNSSLGCSATTSATVTQPASALSVAATSTGTLCSGNATGTINLVVTGGTATYTYVWTASGGGSVPGGQTNNQNLTGLIAGTYSVTVTDARACTATQTVVIGTAPNTAPVISVCPPNYTVEGCGISAITGLVYSTTSVSITAGSFATAGGVATDNCAVTTYSYNDSQSGSCPIKVTRTFTLGDASGLTTTCQQIITVADTTTPTWTTAANALNQTLECSNLAAFAAAELLVPVAGDNCSGTVTYTKTTGIFVPSGGCSQAGSYTNTWIAKDACGNAGATFTQVITIVDTTAPTWTTTAGALNATVNCDDALALSEAQAEKPEAFDLCDTGTLVITKTVAFTASCGGAGTYTNTWTARDACGNVGSTYTQVITVVDNQKPSWVTSQGDLDRYLNCDDAAGLAAAQALFPVAKDNCDTDVSDIVKTPGAPVSNGTCAQAEKIVNTWVVTDACGNKSNTYTQTIYIDDNTNPEIYCPPATAIGYGDSTDTTNTGMATASDNCTPVGSISITFTDVPTVASCTGSYTIQRIWRATDSCGNYNTCTQTISVQDVESPVFINCSTSTSTKADPAKTYATITLPDPVITDNASTVSLTAVTWTMSAPTAGSGTGAIPANFQFNLGTTNITYKVNDPCGNPAECSFSITVTANDPPDITCNADIKQNADTGSCSATVSITAATATPTYSTIAGTRSDGLALTDKYPVGTTTITWVATNISGTDTCVQTVTVVDNQAPTFDVATNTPTYCVSSIESATYDQATEDILPARPDWYIMPAGSAELDITAITDNCCTLTDLIGTLSWTITFSDGHPAVHGTGQPSNYDDPAVPGFPNPITLWGNTDYTVATHTITYTVTDCNDPNLKTTKTLPIVIQPRPKIDKMP